MKEIPDEIFEKVSTLLRGGINLEARTLSESQKIRELSKNAYGNTLLDARLILLSIIYNLLNAKDLIPGNTNESISERLALITVYIQGATVVETQISEGQYIKAASLLKQDYEILARIGELTSGNPKYGKLSNIKNAVGFEPRLYGELNDISHISKSDIINSLLRRYEEGKVVGVSYLPKFQKEIAINLYSLHVSQLFSIVRDYISLMCEMYSEDENFIEESKKNIVMVAQQLEGKGYLEKRSDD